MISTTHSLDSYFNASLLMNYFSFEEVMEMRCIDKTTKAFLDTALHSLYTQVEASLRSHRRYQYIFDWNENELKKISYFIRVLHVYSEIPPTSVRLTLEGFNDAAMKCVSIEKRGEEIEAATMEGNEILVTELLTQGPISKNCRGRAIYHATWEGHETNVNKLLASGPISLDDRSSAFHEAISRGQAQIAIELWSNGPISTFSKIGGVFEACLNDQYRAVGRLVAHTFGY